MPLYNELSPSDQAVVQNTVNAVRGACSQMAQIWNKIKAIADDTNAVSLVTSIDAGANGVIPNTSGLGGADDLTRDEVVALYSLLAGIRTTNDTAPNRAAMSKAAGINAMVG